ncbi:MAG: M48 family metalloprotease [Desulfatibacillaceae bacterium]
MYGSVIYFVIVLLVYSTYEPNREPSVPLEWAVLNAGLLVAVFTAVSRTRFQLLARRLFSGRRANRFTDFDAVMSQQTVLAIAFYAIYIYVLDLKSHVAWLPVVKSLPTLGALFFIAVFFAHLFLLWFVAYPVYVLLQGSDLTRADYLRANARLSLPVLFPWLCISIVVDLLVLVPLGPASVLLETMWGNLLLIALGVSLLLVFGPVAIVRFWGCTPLGESPIRRRMEDLCRRTGLETAGFMRWPIFGGHMITAGVMGVVGRFRYILVTDGLLRHLTPREIDSVVAHEIGHVKKKHMYFYVLFFVCFSPLVLINLQVTGWALAGAEWGALPFIEPGPIGPTTASAVLAATSILVFLVYFRLVFGYFIRNFERQADLYAFELMDTARPMVSVFEKIVKQTGRPPEEPNWHHFSITERVNNLMLCEVDRSRVRRHERKVKTSVALFLAGALLVGGVAWWVYSEPVRARVSSYIVEGVLDGGVEDLTPERLDGMGTERLRMLGELFYGTGREQKALAVYREILERTPNDPEALNTVAWIHATAADQSLIDAEKALRLAEKAVRLSPQPHILDTYAESLYLNGQYEKAVEVEKRALSMTTEGRDTYRRQLEKFTKAMEDAK